LDYLYLGDCNHGMSYGSLKELNITRILRVTDCGGYDSPENYRILHLQVADHPRCDLCKHFSEMFKFIEEGINAKEGVLVHCEQGVSRSASVVIGFLIYHKRMSLREAIVYTRSKRSIINPNNGFMRQLYGYEKELLNSNSVDESLFAEDWGSGSMFVT